MVNILYKIFNRATNMTENSGDTCYYDIEDELVKFTICSNHPQNKNEKSRWLRNYKSEEELIPLLVKDILGLTLPDRSFAETITAFGIPFATVLIYGRISTTGASANGRLRYCLDDGTGTIQVRLLKLKCLKEATKLDLQCARMFGHNKELYQSVQNLLKTTRKQMLDISFLPYGTKVLLIGRPHRCYDEIVFSVFEMIVDVDNSNDLELSVKNFIIDWYTNRYKNLVKK